MKLIPALRGIFGSWVYYSALLRLKDVANHIKLLEEIYQNKQLSDTIQRELKTNQVTEIAEYLCTQKERFLNSLVVGLYGGDPKWFAISDIRPHTPEFDPSTLDEETLSSIGFLSLSGDETFFAIDGQHRLVGIRKALKEDDELGLDEINVLFVPYQETDEGRQRTGRLFTTLNKRVKPVSK